MGSGGSVGMSDVGADVGVGCVDGGVGAAVAAAEAAGTGVGVAIVGTGVRAGVSVITCDDAGAVGADEACGRCAGAIDPAASGGCCDARSGVGERKGPGEVAAGGGTAGEPRSGPDAPVREMSLGTTMRMPTTTPSVAPMIISRSCSIALSFASKNATSRLPDPNPMRPSTVADDRSGQGDDRLTLGGFMLRPALAAYRSTSGVRRDPRRVPASGRMTGPASGRLRSRLQPARAWPRRRDHRRSG